MGDDLDDAIRTNAEGPASASDETGGVTQHTLADQIAADRYLQGKAAFKNRRSLGIHPVAFHVQPPACQTTAPPLNPEPFQGSPEAAPEPLNVSG